jgi:triosephosphate isomerase
MSHSRQIIVAGNWKLNKNPNETVEFLEEVKAKVSKG